MSINLLRILACYSLLNFSSSSPMEISHIQKRDVDDIFVFPGDEYQDPFDEDAYSEDEKKCLSARKFFVMGKCHTLATKGPCGQGELLLLEKTLDELKPICKAKLCKDPNEMWWPESGKCEMKSWIQAEKCRGANKAVVVDSYGEATCSCAGNYGQILGREQCYEYYQRGPCGTDQVVTYNITTGHAECTRDLCYEDNLRIKRSTRCRRATARTSRRNAFAPLEGSGKCLRLSSSEPCLLVGSQSKFVVDQLVHVPRCSVSDLTLNVIGAPTLCRLDHNNKCREQVNIKQEDRLAYLKQLRSQLLAKKT